MYLELPPRFDCWQEVVEWEERQKCDGHPRMAVAEFYISLNHSAALTRAAILLNLLRLDDWRDEILQHAYSRADTRLEQLYVLVVSYTARRSRTMLMLEADDLTYGDLLEGYLREVRALPDAGVSRFEVEYRVLEALHFDLFAGGENARAIAVAKEMILLATVARVSQAIMKARRCYQSAVAQAGRYHEDLTERMRTLQGLAPTDEGFLKEKSGLAIAQLNVGDLEGALGTAQEDPALPLHAALVQAFRGRFDAASEDHFPDKKLGWIARCLWFLARVGSLPPWRVNDRRALVLGALEVVRQEQWRRGPTDRAFVLWLEARCRLEAGEYGLVRHLVDEVPHLEAEDLLTRTLLAGARLDLALTDETFQTQTVARSEDELRAIFGHARGLRHGSAAGLAEVLRRWHPRPAAYMALCPGPVPELLSASEAILKCHRRAEVYGLILPPLVALDEALRAFDLPPVAERPGSNARFQRQRLMIRNGTLDYWRPVVLAAQLVTGMRSVKSAAHQHAADRLALEFGLVPTNIPRGLKGLAEVLTAAIKQKGERLTVPPGL